MAICPLLTVHAGGSGPPSLSTVQRSEAVKRWGRRRVLDRTVRYVGPFLTTCFAFLFPSRPHPSHTVAGFPRGLIASRIPQSPGTAKTMADTDAEESPRAGRLTAIAAACAARECAQALVADGALEALSDALTCGSLAPQWAPRCITALRHLQPHDRVHVLCGEACVRALSELVLRADPPAKEDLFWVVSRVFEHMFCRSARSPVVTARHMRVLGTCCGAASPVTRCTAAQCLAAVSGAAEAALERSSAACDVVLGAATRLTEAAGAVRACATGSLALLRAVSQCFANVAAWPRAKTRFDAAAVQAVISLAGARDAAVQRNAVRCLRNLSLQGPLGIARSASPEEEADRTCLTLRCCMGDAAVLLSVARDVSYADLMRRLAEDEYDAGVCVAYRGLGGRRLIVDSEHALRRAIAWHEEACGGRAAPRVALELDVRRGAPSKLSTADEPQATPDTPPDAAQRDCGHVTLVGTAGLKAPCATTAALPKAGAVPEAVGPGPGHSGFADEAEADTGAAKDHRLGTPATSAPERGAESDSVAESAPPRHRGMSARRDRDPSAEGAKRKRIRWMRGNLIGSGAFAAVYQGLNTDTGQLMAIKQVTMTRARAATEFANFRKEIAFLQRFAHPNIVQYLGAQRDGMHLNILMEYVPGGSIAMLLRKYSRLPERVVKGYVWQILTGLSYLHGREVVHCDIKGANILLTDDGVIKLADFGASCKLLELAGTERPLLGTPGYMAPEVILSQACSAKSDLWSVGATVYEMCTGTRPHSDLSNPHAVMYCVARGGPPPIPADISADGRDFLELCFRRHAALRPTADELLLHTFLDLPLSRGSSTESLADALTWEGGLSSNSSGSPSSSGGSSRPYSDEDSDEDSDEGGSEWCSGQYSGEEGSDTDSDSPSRGSGPAPVAVPSELFLGG